MRKLIFERVEVLVCEQFKGSLGWFLALMEWNEGWLDLISARIIGIFEVFDFLLVHLNLDLLFICQMTHVVRIIVDNEAVVWRHSSREWNGKSRRIWIF